MRPPEAAGLSPRIRVWSFVGHHHLFLLSILSVTAVRVCLEFYTLKPAVMEAKLNFTQTCRAYIMRHNLEATSNSTTYAHIFHN
ncbi:hypothetical protein EV401DRAFT_79322 [Pisolithus croceorrhizus]|nr:hypothetical protein EV401DRAFT_79322 [Pisolithus croceorrhizus]